jgi:beta-alanine degradation protein BauB
MTRNLSDLKPAIATVQEDNDRVTVTRWHFPPGSETGWHRHGHDYVVVPTIAGTLTIVETDGSQREVAYVPAASYFRTLGAEHNVVNLSDGVVEFVEIELKQETRR